MKTNIENTNITMGIRTYLYIVSIVLIGMFWVLFFIGQGYAQRLEETEKLATENKIKIAILGEKIDTLVDGQKDMKENIEKIAIFLMSNNNKRRKR